MTLRILYLTGNGFPRSTTDPRGTFSFEHVRALRALGAEVTSVDLQADDFGNDVVDGVPIVRIPRLRPILKARAFGRLRRYLAARRRLRTGSYDAVIFSFAYLKYLPLMFALKRTGVKILVIPHGGDVMPAGALTRFFKRRLFALADVITPVSDYTETLVSCLIGRRDADNARIVTIYNGIDSSKLQSDRDPADLRTKLGLPSDAFVVLSVCNLVKRKGIDVVIKAVGRLIGEGRAVHHLIIGHGVEADNLANLTRQTDKPENFQFVGSVSREELVDFYRTSDLFAMFSTTSWDARQTEGFGITYAEAMAVGTPVIGGSGSGTSTPIKHGFTGVLIDPHLPQVDAKVAAEIARFMDDDAYRNRISQNAAQHMQENFSWAANARATLDALERSRSGR